MLDQAGKGLLRAGAFALAGGVLRNDYAADSLTPGARPALSKTESAALTLTPRGLPIHFEQCG